MALTGGNIAFTGYQQPDYSGVVQAAGLPMQVIGQGIDEYKKAQEDRKKLDASIKASITGIESAIKMGDSLGIDTKSSLQPYLDQMRDPNVSPMEAAAFGREAANGISNILNFGTKANEFNLQKSQIEQAAAANKAKAIAEANKPGDIVNIHTPEGDRQMLRNPQTGALEPLKVAGVSQGTSLVDLVKGFEGFNPNAYGDYKQTSIGYGTKGKEGEVLTEPQASERLNTELSGHAKTIEDAFKLKGIKFNQNQLNALTSFDFNTGRGADLIQRFGDKPEELVSKMLEYTKAGGGDIPGLVKRRNIEAALFMTPEESPIGFKPTPDKQTFRPATDEELARYHAVAGQMSSTGRFFPVNLPPGMTVESDGHGGIKVIQGSGVGGTGGKEPAVKLGEGQQLVPDPNSPTGSRIVQTPSDLINKNKDDFSSYVSQIANSYAGLDRMGKAVTGNNSNPMNYLESTEGGQTLARMFGSDPQVLRDRINTMRPNIINVIRKSSEMGAKGMDSEKELSFYLSALGDPKIPVEANIKALDTLDKVYGNGKAVDAIISDFPELKKRVDKYDLQFNSSSTNADKQNQPPPKKSNDLESKSQAIYKEFGIK